MRLIVWLMPTNYGRCVVWFTFGCIILLPIVMSCYVKYVAFFYNWLLDDKIEIDFGNWRNVKSPHYERLNIKDYNVL